MEAFWSQPCFSPSPGREQAAVPPRATHLRQQDDSFPVWPDDVVHLGPHPLPGQLGCAQARLKHGVRTVKARAGSRKEKLQKRKEKRKQLADIMRVSFGPSPMKPL